jgi:hypothetical protein
VDADGFKELPNECAGFGTVVIEGFVGPLAGDQDSTSANA